MYDYTIRIKKDNRTICAIGANHLQYDNVIWWQLAKLVKIVSGGFATVEQLAKMIEDGTEYFHQAAEYADSDPVLDLDSETIDMPWFPVYKQEEVCPEECCISLKIKDGKYYSVYEDGEEYLMNNVEFDDADLLKKRTVSLKEFKKVCDFVDRIIMNDETDFVLNKELIIRFNNA